MKLPGTGVSWKLALAGHVASATSADEDESPLEDTGSGFQS